MRTRHPLALLGAFLATTACAKAAATTSPAAAPAPAAAAAPAATPAAATVAAPAAAPAAAVDPVGRWSVALVAQGQQFDFVMDLRRGTGNEYTGVVTSQMFPPMNITKATLTGNRLRMQIPAPTGDEATFDLVFDKDTFTGDWAMPGDGSKVSGKRLP